MKFLVKLGSDLDLRCVDQENGGRTVLLDAAKRGRVDIFGLLLTMGADPDLRCNRGKTLGDYIREDYSEAFDYDP
jgi:ankyrin repeat protein